MSTHLREKHAVAIKCRDLCSRGIPIDRIYADGVWQSGNVFSRMWQISDINYAMQSDAAKQNILTQLGTLYAGIPADCWMQVCIVSQRMDEKSLCP